MNNFHTPKTTTNDPTPKTPPRAGRFALRCIGFTRTFVIACLFSLTACRPADHLDIPEHVDLGHQTVSKDKLHQMLDEHPDQAVTRRGGKNDAGQRRLETYSKVYNVEQIHRSMKGPQTMVAVQIAPELEKPQTVWVTGYHSHVVTADGAADRSQEFLCHSNLDTLAKYPSLAHSRIPRLFTLSQGQHSIRFPEGFGIPLQSDEKLSLWTQLLNLNYTGPSIPLRYKIAVDYVRDSEKRAPMVPLMMTFANVLVALDEDPSALRDEVLDFAGGGMSCAIGGHALSGNDAGVFCRSDGTKYSLHWVVKPGRHEYQRRLRGLPMLDFDTTLHYVAVHLHPFAEYIELFDVTDNRLVHRSEAINPAKGIGLDKVEDWSSVEGKPLFRDHEYIVRCGYNNTTNEEQDSMAALFLYAKDKRYDQNITRVVDEFLEKKGAFPLQGTVDELLADPSFKPVESDLHPLLGKPAPNVTLLNQNDKPVSLAQLTTSGPAVLVFYYGYYCDHCVAQLYHLQQDLHHFDGMGATIAAISGDTPETTRLKMTKNNPFRFLLLFDEGTAATDYQTKIPQEVDLVGQNLHGTFIIDQNGVVRWAKTGTQPFLDNKTLLVELKKIAKPVK